MLINIPADLYVELQAVADNADQPLEDLVVNRLRGLVHDPIAALPADEQAELAALSFLSDDALKAMVGERLPDNVQVRAHLLLEKNAQGSITETESSELHNLIERADQVMVRKAKAADILMQRGYEITLQDYKPKV